LPRGQLGFEPFANAHRLGGWPESVESTIAVPDQVTSDLAPRKCLAQLLSGPGCRWTGRNRNVHDASTIVGQHYQDEQEAARCGRDHEEVGRDELSNVIPQERAPCLRGWLPTANDVFGDRRLRDVDPELQQFTVDTGRARQQARI